VIFILQLEMISYTSALHNLLRAAGHLTMIFKSLRAGGMQNVIIITTQNSKHLAELSGLFLLAFNIIANYSKSNKQISI